MNIKEFEKFEEDMTVFSFKYHQEFLTYLNKLKAHGWTVEDVQRYVEHKTKELTKDDVEIQSLITRPCEICDEVMLLLRVNTSKATMTGDPKDKYVWFCRGCGESIYTHKTREQILNEGGN